ncbi:MAG: diaminopimelate decarboxylase [Oscillospiraceae bacterium]|nr:diaminopimelate decarboxylase [Oscillospiraceae bacterium]
MLFGNVDRNAQGHLTFAGYDTVALAEQYGTPLYLMDEERIRENCRLYRSAFRKYFGENALPLYASKAASFQRVYQIAEEEGMGVDTVSSGEIYTALRAGFPAERIYFHGNCKTDADIRYGVRSNIGYFVVDNEEELLQLDREAGQAGIRQKILLRLTPGIDPHTYEAVSTGKVNSKFGSAIETGQADAFAAEALRMEHLELRGIHCHVGSQVFEEDVYQRAMDIMFRFMADVREKYGATLTELNMGGGYGVRYTAQDSLIDIDARLFEVADHLKKLAAQMNFPMPRFLMEPGRSIVADAGMTLYSVGSVKRIPGYKNYVAVDGGMTDNPRYALYGARYTVLHAERDGEKEDCFDLVGRCCESGDILQPKVMLPDSVHRGDKVAVCTTGAYNYSMASNYNRIPRPPVVMLAKDRTYVAVRRETAEDLTARDV